MVKIILGSSADDKKSSLEDLKHKVASYLYCCSDWEYSYMVFNNRLVVLTDFSISKMLDFVSVLRDTCNRSEFWFFHEIEYIC